MRMTRKIRRAWLRGKPEWAKCYKLKQRQRKQTEIINFVQPENRLHKYSRYLVAGVMLACLGIGHASMASASNIAVKDSAYAGTVVTNGNVIDIYNQQVNDNGSALNAFTNFELTQDNIANLHLDAHNGVAAADRQINLVDNMVSIYGVLNSFKNGKIGGNIYFFSEKGIAVGSTGVINVGSLTLGTNTNVIPSIYYEGASFEQRSAYDRAYSIAGERDITVYGTINSIGDVVLGGKNVTVGQAASINTSASFTNDGVPNTAWTTAADYRANFMNLNGVSEAVSATKTSTGDIALFGTSNIAFSGDAYTAGGDFKAGSDNLISFTGTEADGTVDKAEVITNGGDVGLSVVRADRADVKIELENTKLDADDRTTANENGNVDIAASTVSKTLSWAMEGNKAEIVITDSKVAGDNVNINAIATISGEVGADDSSVTYTDTEIQANIEERATAENETPVWDLIADVSGFSIPNLRTLVSATDVEAYSEVKIINSEIDAIGGSKANIITDENNKHGNLNISTVANSQVITSGLGLINFSVIVGLSDVDSHITITNSDLNAKNNIKLEAKGDNTVNLAYLDLSLIDMVEKLRGTPSAGFNWAELNSDVQVNVDSASEVQARNEFTVSAESIRNLSSDTVAGGDTDKVGVVTSVALADTNAAANVGATIYAGGAVDVSALNSVARDGDFYVTDTSAAESMSGNTFIGKPVMNEVKRAMNKLITSVSSYSGFDVAGVPGKSGDWGLNAATAILVSKNDATASVTGKVRGFDANGAISDTVGAGSLNVHAENISRTSIGAASYQNELTNLNKEVINSKDTGISLAVNVGLQDNTATAFIGGDIKTTGGISVEAVSRIPWETTFSDLTISGIIGNIFGSITDPNLNLGSMTDSWAQASATTNKVGAAGSVGVIEYGNKAEAYVAKNASVEAGGELNVDALTDVTTVNFSGNITSPINMLPIAAIWEGTKLVFKPDMWGATGEGAALGGAALAVRQKNVAKAYIADSDVENSAIKGGVTAGKVDVNAKNQSINVGVLASGGTSETVAIDGTVGVFRIENEVDAHIGQADVTANTVAGLAGSGNVTVNALDASYNINIAGVVATGDTAASIGATIAYNHIDRDTSAYINGNVTAADGISISAENDGLIVATSVAGAVTYNSKVENVTTNAGGSTGTHVHNEVSTSDGTTSIVENESLSDDEIADLAGGLLNVGGANIFDENATLDTGENTVNNVAAQDQGTGVAAAQTGFAVSANVAVNRILDNADAYIAPTANVQSGTEDSDASKVNSAIDPVLAAKYVRVHALNDSEIVAANATASINTTAGKASTGVAGSFMYNSITSGNNAYVKDATITVSGNTGTVTNSDNNAEEIDEALTISAENLEKIINTSISGSVAPKGNAVVGQISVNRIDNTTKAYAEDSIIHAAEKTAVSAEDEAEIQSYTGVASLTGGAVGIGAAIGVQDIDTATTAYVADTEITGITSSANGTTTTKNGNLDVTAVENSDITSIVATAGVGINTSMVATFSVSANDVDTKTNAYIDNDENIKAAAIKVAAQNMANTTIGVGQLSVGKNTVGAASAIALSTNAVEAYIKGDDDATDDAEHTIEASSIDVNAANIYNGSAKDGAEDDTTAKTVAVGGSVAATGSVSAAGSVTVNIIDNDTKAHIDEGTYAVDGAVNVDAQSKAYMFGLAGGVSIAKGVGLGAAVDTQLMDADTQAYIADKVKVTKAGNITVKADSIEEITSVAVVAGGGQYFAGAAAANAHDITVNTVAYIGSDTAADANETTVTNAGDVSVTASDKAELASNAGVAAVVISASGGAALSGSAAVELLDKNVQASVGKTNINANKLTVDAINTGKVITTANGIAVAGALYGGALSGSASESIINYVTDAHLAGGAAVTAVDDVLINADSSFEHVGEATALAGGTLVGAGLSNDTSVIGMQTLSHVGDSATVTADNVAVTADNLVKITSAVVSGSAAAVGLNGGVGVNAIDNETKAYIGRFANVTVDGTGENDGITVHAQDTTEIDGGSGGLTAGLGNAGASVNVNTIDKDTQAYIGASSVLKNTGATTIEAINKEDILNVTVQGTGGLAAGLAGAVGVHDLDIITKAYTDTSVKINENATGKNISVAARHDLDSSSSVVGATFGGVGIGAAVDVVSVDSQTNAYIGNSNVINASALNVTATENLGTADNRIDSTAVAGAVGGLTVSGSVSVYNFGSSMSAEDAALLNVKDENGNAQSFDAFVAEYINQSNTGTALSNYEGNEVATGIKNDVDEHDFTANVTTGSTAGALGTVAKLGNDSVINASSINVNAQGNTYTDTNVGTGSAGAVAAGASVGVVHNDGVVNAIVDNGAQITTTNTFNINAKAVSDLNGLAVAPAVGIIAGSAASLDLNSATEVVTNIGNNVVLSANTITINAETTPKINAYATGVGVGIAGVGTVVAFADSDDTAAVVIGSGTSMSSTDNINIAAKNSAPADGYTAYVKAEAGSGGVLTDCSVTASQIDLTNEATVTIGGGGSISAKAVTIEAKHEDAINYENLSAGAAGVSGLGSDNMVNVVSNVGINLAADGSVVTDDTQKLNITADEAVTVKAENISVKDWLNAEADNAVGEADYNALSAGASLAGGSGIVNITNINHNTDINLDNVVVKANAADAGDNTIAVDAEENVIVVDAYSYVKSKDYQYIGTGAVIEAAEINDDNNVNAVTNVNVGSGAKLYAGDTALANSEGSTINVGGSGTYGTNTVAGGNIAIGTRNDADMYSKTIVNTWGGVGVVGATNDVIYNGHTNVNFNGYAETANGDVRLAAGRDSSGTASLINATADTTLINGTVVPISHTADPTAKAVNAALLTVGSGANVKSDADVYLQSNAGTIDTLGTGEVYDWAHAVGEAFGSSSWKTGNNITETSANVNVAGTVETGIHRNQSLTVGGSNVNNNKATNKWYTQVTRTNGIGFEYTEGQELQHQLSTRLETLRRLRAEYIADPSTVAIYDKEIKLIQDQMVALGLAYYDGTAFVEYNLTTMNSNANMLYSSAEANSLKTKVTGLITAYTALANSATSDTDKAKYNGYVTKLNEFNTYIQEKLDAIAAFTEAGNTITDDGKFLVGNTEVNSYAKNETGSFIFSYVASDSVSNSMTSNKVVLDDITIKLGDIIVEGDNLYGNGNLLANADATVTITNNSPDDIVVNDIKIIGNRTTDDKIFDGANISFNGSYVNTNEEISDRNLDSSKTAAFGNIKNNSNSASSVTITNNFNPSSYPVKSLNDAAASSEKIFVASDITIAEGSKVYNPYGSVNVSSNYGDVYNYGTIDAASVNIEVDNGSYSQIATDTNNIINIGGDPGTIYGNTEVLGSGIYANGNIVIKARYVNINSTIQSGRDAWTLTIPDFHKSEVLEAIDISVYWYENGTKKPGVLSYVVSSAFREELVDNGIIYFAEDKDTEALFGNAHKHLSYDLNNEKFILDGLEIHGGNVDITGTILNTSSDEAGKIIALDGYGSISIDNQSGKDLEIRNLSTGEGSEGVIKITDLDRETGAVNRTTTYTRLNGKIYVNGEVASDADATSTVAYTPAANYYVWQTGQDSSTVTEYHYSDSEASIWWDDGDFEDEDLEDMDVVSVSTGDEYDLPNGVLVAGTAQINSSDKNVETDYSKNLKDDNYKQYTQTITTSTSDPYDERTETHRVWYTLWIVQEYDHWFKVKTGTTTITQNSLKANNPIGIQFIGNENGGGLNIAGHSADVILNGMISNLEGTTNISAANIVQGNNGYIKTNELVVNAIGTTDTAGTNPGSIGIDTSGNIKAIQTNASQLSGSANGGSLAVDVLHGGVNLGNITAGTTVSIQAVGDITQSDDATVSANRVELYSETGGIGSSAKNISLAMNTPAKDADGNVVKNAAYGLKAQAADGIYITNTNGDLYLDRVISKTGDVLLSTEGAFIDNNFTDCVDKDAVTKLKESEQAQILEKKESTANLQKQLLISMAESKYNRYQALKENIVTDDDGNAAFVLNDLDKAALQKLGYSDAQIAEYAANKLQEYNTLLAQGAATWTETGLKAYTTAIKAQTASDTVMANAGLQASGLAEHEFAADGVEFLTADEKAQILVGSAHAESDILNSSSVGSLKEITDTNLVIKDVANIQGDSVYLNANSIGNKVVTTYSTPIDVAAIEAKNYDDWSNDEKTFMALYYSAERGDVTLDADGKVTAIAVVKPIVVDTSATISLSAGENIYLASEGDIVFDEITAYDEVRIKAYGNINRKEIGGNVTDFDGTITSGGRVVLESAHGAIKGITLADYAQPQLLTVDEETTPEMVDTEKYGLIARAAEDISINKAGDLMVDTVFSANGDVTLKVFDGESKSDITVLYEPDNINISANNIALLGVDNLGTTDAAVGLKINNINDVEDGTIAVAADGNVYMTTQGTINELAISGATISHQNLGIINGGTVAAAADLTLTNGNVVNGGTFISSGELTVTNSGTVNGVELKSTDADVVITANKDSVNNDLTVVAKGLVANTTEADISFKSITTENATNITTTTSGDVTIANVEADRLSMSAAGDIVIGTADIEEDSVIKAAKDVAITTISSKALDIGVHNIIVVTAGVSGTAELTGSGDVAVQQVKAGTLDVDGQNITVGVASVSETVALTGSDDVAVQQVKATNLDVDGQNITVGTASVSEAAELTASSGVTVQQVKATNLDVDGQNITIGTAGVSGVAVLTGSGDVAVQQVKAGTLDVDGQNITVGIASVSGAAALTAGNDIAVQTLQAKDVDIDALNDIDLGTVVANDSIAVTGKNVEAGVLKAATLDVDAQEDVEVGTTITTGLADFASGGNTALTNVEAESLVVNASGDVIISTADINTSTTINSGTSTAIDGISSGSLDVEAGTSVEVGTAKVDTSTTIDSGASTVIDGISSVSLDVEADTSVEIGTADIDTSTTIDSGTSTAIDGISSGSLGVEADTSVEIGTADINTSTTIDSGTSTAIYGISSGSLDVEADTSVEIGTADINTSTTIDSGTSTAIAGISSGSLDVEAGTSVEVGTADIEQLTEITSDEQTTIGSLQTGSLTVVAGTDFVATTVRGGDISITAGEDITVSTQSVVNSLDGVAVGTPDAIGNTDAAGAILTAQAKQDDINFADDTGNGLLSSDTGNITLTAGETMAVDVLETNNGLIDVTANAVGIDDVQNMGSGTTQLTINGVDGGAAYYAGVGTSDSNALQIVDSVVQDIYVTAVDNAGLHDTTITGDGRIVAGEVQVDIIHNPNNNYSFSIGDILVSLDDVATTEPFAWTIDGVTINGSHSEPTYLNVAEGSLYASEYAGKDSEEDEREDSEKHHTEIVFSEVAHHEDYEDL